VYDRVPIATRIGIGRLIISEIIAKRYETVEEDKESREEKRKGDGDIFTARMHSRRKIRAA